MSLEKRIAGFLKYFFTEWLSDFKWVEFTGYIIGAFTAGLMLAQSLGMPTQIGKYFGYFGAVSTALSYMRNPKSLNWNKEQNESKDNE